MAREIGTHLMRTLAAAGVVLSTGLLNSLLAAYQREAEDAVADSYAVASINGLVYDRHEEEIEVQTFAGALRAAIAEFLADPAGPPLVPNWARVWAGLQRRRADAGGGGRRRARVSAMSGGRGLASRGANGASRSAGTCRRPDYTRPLLDPSPEQRRALSRRSSPVLYGEEGAEAPLPRAAAADALLLRAQDAAR